MSQLDDLLPDPLPIDDGGTLLLEVVAAVDYLRRGVFPGLTVWDAFEQALRWHANVDADFDNPDPLRRAIGLALDPSRFDTAATTFSNAVRNWLTATSSVYNESHGFDRRWSTSRTTR